MEQTAIPLPKFLKIFTSNNVPLPKAMVVAGKIYKDYNTPAKLEILDEAKLLAAGVDDKDSRKIVMTALRKAGYRVKSTRPNQSPAGPSTQPMTAVEVLTTPTKRKRKRPVEDVNEFLPFPKDETANIGNLQFDEVMDEQVLKTKSTVVNRAPLMTAWSTLVAERLGFQREEALSIASVYTEMNAVSKGVSMGIYKPGTQFQRSLEAAKEGSQPYVELMGRRPLFKTQDSQWRALSNGTVVHPSTAFAYISRALRQTTPHIIGALRLLVESFTPEEINARGWALYADFRPDVKGWGERAEVKCETILSLRKSTGTADPAGKVDAVVKSESLGHEEDSEPPQKRTRGLTLEEYEAALEQDTTFDDINLDLGPDDNT
ncbi:Glutamine synthetase [Mycena sanguinolenta]|uniref:Glutamine synthetase n=1 Tax=Mycena sanguinolenta TaxID=230812 RepID=A0A8H6Y8W5_9AGAR|nr:Glutamine synthetase [Mycena sanguinolenta]